MGAAGAVPDGAKMFLAGGMAGAVARTSSAPLDRTKLLFQVQGAGALAGQQYTSIPQAMAKILREEGFLAFWKGNGTNIIRIFPYSAAQLMANDFYKRQLAGADGRLEVWQRLTAGACAGMTATAITHPLDTLRLRLALPNHGYTGFRNALTTVVRTEGPLALYKGLAPTLVGIAPYAALNFSLYDLAKARFYDGDKPQNPWSNLLLGAATGTCAATVCYPLDTVRRQMQMPGCTHKGQLDAFATIFAQEGARGFYRGWLANTLKVVPQNAIRFVSYEFMKGLLGIQKKKTDT